MKPKMSKEEIDNRIIQLGDRLVRCTEQKEEETGLTQNQQGDAMGIKGPSLSRYHETEGKNPLDEKCDKKVQVMSVKQLIRICDYYGVSADYMLGFTNDPEPIRKNGNHLVREICDYTGLQRDSVETLHGISNPIQKEALNFILQDDATRAALLEYYLYSIIDLLQDSDYVKLLAHPHNSPCRTDYQKINDLGYASLLRTLPISQKKFSEKIRSGNLRINNVVIALAGLYVNTKHAYNICIRQRASAKLKRKAATDDLAAQQLQKREQKFLLCMELIEEIKSQTVPENSDRFSVFHENEKNIANIKEMVSLINAKPWLNEKDSCN